MSTDRWREMASDYVLGLLEAEEARAFEAHLAECTNDCRREVRELREAAAELAHTAPRRRPPEDLRDRVLGRIESGRSVPQSSSKNLWRWAAAAGVILTLGAGILYQTEREARQAVEAEAERLRTELAGAVSELEDREELLRTLITPELRVAEMAPSGTGPTGRVFWDPDRARGLFVAFRLPPLEEGRTYQLWGLPPGEEPVSLGTFEPGSDGRAVLQVSVPEGVSLAASAVTDEPEGGSPQPTTTPLLVGEFSGAP